MLICTLLILAAALFANEEAVPAAVDFHGFAWGTSMQHFISEAGLPVHQDEINGLQSLLYENLSISGYPVFMVAYFSGNGLEGGTYYFNTHTFDELVQCYTNMQKELLEKFGTTFLCLPIMREPYDYESVWFLDSGYIRLKVDTRLNDPVSLWFSSPGLTSRLGITRAAFIPSAARAN